MTAKSDELVNELVSAAIAFGREKEPDWQTRIETALCALKAHVEELEAAQRWIPVSERLPELDQDVLAIVEGDIVTGHFYQQWDGEIYFSSDDEGAMMVATHWMPLPKLPEVQDVSIL